MNNFQKGSSILCVGACFVVGIYAADTIIENITGGQVSDRAGSYGNNTMTMNTGDLKFINQNGDTQIVGDYFAGHYYDPAFGVFRTDSSVSDRVRVSNTNISGCGSGYDGYKLEGFSYSDNFGFVDFNYDASNYVFICSPQDSTDDTLESYLGGYAYSSLIGFQNFDGLRIDTSVDFDDDHDSEGRFIKVEGLVSSGSDLELLADQFQNDVRVLGATDKTSLRRDIHRNIYSVISNISPEVLTSSYNMPSIHLQNNDWSFSTRGTKIVNDSILYFEGNQVRLGGNNDISGEKTLIIEGGDIYITGNIRNQDDTGILGIIALEKDGVGGNIYIDPSVTDIHAIIYADRSLISYDGNELDGSTPAGDLANQLYILGSVFSENTFGASQNTPHECPYYVNSCVSQDIAMKYDLNFLRKYILVQPVDGDGNPVGDKIPQFGGAESYMGDNDRSNTETQKPGYRKYPIIIEFDPRIQISPPPFFGK